MMERLYIGDLVKVKKYNEIYIGYISDITECKFGNSLDGYEYAISAERKPTIHFCGFASCDFVGNSAWYKRDEIIEIIEKSYFRENKNE